MSAAERCPGCFPPRGAWGSGGRGAGSSSKSLANPATSSASSRCGIPRSACGRVALGSAARGTMTRRAGGRQRHAGALRVENVVCARSAMSGDRSARAGRDDVASPVRQLASVVAVCEYTASTARRSTDRADLLHSAVSWSCRASWRTSRVAPAPAEGRSFPSWRPRLPWSCAYRRRCSRAARPLPSRARFAPATDRERDHRSSTGRARPRARRRRRVGVVDGGMARRGPSFEPGGPVFALYVLLVVPPSRPSGGSPAPVPPLVGQLLAGACSATSTVVEPRRRRRRPPRIVRFRANRRPRRHTRPRRSLPGRRRRVAPPASRSPGSVAARRRRGVDCCTPRAIRRRNSDPQPHTPSPSASSWPAIPRRGHTLRAEIRNAGWRPGGRAGVDHHRASVGCSCFAIHRGSAARAGAPRNGKRRRGGVAWRVPAQIAGGCVAGYLAAERSARPRWKRLRFWSRAPAYRQSFGARRRVCALLGPRSDDACVGPDGRGAPGAFRRRARGTDRRRGVGGGRGVGDGGARVGRVREARGGRAEPRVDARRAARCSSRS